MQKLDFVQALNELVKSLESVAFSEYISNAIERPVEEFKFGSLTPKLFTSKSNFERIKLNPLLYTIISNMDFDDIYDEHNLSVLSRIFNTRNASSVLSHAVAVKFFNAHQILVKLANIAEITLLDNSTTDFENSMDNGILIVQVVINGESLPTEKYLKILSTIDELITTIEKVNGEQPKSPELVLLDSGSDTNFGLKSSAETVKSVFLVFKEVWDFIVNHKAYKQSIQNKSLLDSLTIRETIAQKVKDQVITPEEGMAYTHIIKSRTEELIGMKVLPKSLIKNVTYFDNRRQLSGLDNQRFISGVDNKDED